jgi:hypothetical protein
MKHLLLTLACAPALAHVMSISHGDLTITGTKARYELKMPMYEITHVTRPVSLLDSIEFSFDSQAARRTSASCQEVPAEGNLVCVAEYTLPAEGDLLIRSRLHEQTVPNHVHMLRAMRDGKRDQAIFDASFNEARMRFRPPSPTEVVVRDALAGARRALGGWVQIAFLAALALASRSWREFAAVLAAFIVGQVLSAIVTPRTGWEPAPTFVEAAMALTLSYMAVEILALPEGRYRWIVAGVLGVFHGWYFALFLSATEASAAPVLAGAIIPEAALSALFAVPALRLAGFPWFARIASCLMLLAGLIWFFVRLRG